MSYQCHEVRWETTSASQVLRVVAIASSLVTKAYTPHYRTKRWPEEARGALSLSFTAIMQVALARLRLFAWPFRHVHLQGMAERVEYAQLLNDASEVKRLCH
jgi:hypothetical protein